MRKFLKFLHSLASCGLIGGLLVYAILLAEAHRDTPADLAHLRWSIAALSNYLLIPSLALALVTGLLSMVVHRRFLDKRWAWIKAALGLLMFKGVLTIVGAKADHAAALAERIASGAADVDALDSALAYEWATLAALLTLSVANVVLGVWRPRLAWRSRSAAQGAIPAHWERDGAAAAERASGGRSSSRGIVAAGQARSQRDTAGQR